MIFYPLEKLLFVTEGYKRSFNINGHDLLLIQHLNQRFLIANRCPHQQKLLTHGRVFNHCIRCPHHGLEFDLRTGQLCHRMDQQTLNYRLTHYSLHYQDNLIGCYL